MAQNVSLQPFLNLVLVNKYPLDGVYKSNFSILIIIFISHCIETFSMVFKHCDAILSRK